MLAVIHPRGKQCDFLRAIGCGENALTVSVVLAEAAIQSGFGAYFITAHDLATDLGKAYREGRLDRRMRIYLAPKVLVIHEVWGPRSDLACSHKVLKSQKVRAACIEPPFVLRKAK